MPNLMSTLSLEIQTPVAGVFVLNRSALGGPDKLATGTASGLEWTPVLCDATGINITRGGSRGDVGFSVDVGTLRAAFVNGVDPTSNSNWRPGVGLRLVCKTPTAQTIYTGTTSDFRVAYDKETDNAYVSMGGVDAVQRLANTTRYGAASPAAEFESWQRRAQRVLQSSPVPYVAPYAPIDGTVIYYASLTEAALWTPGPSGPWTVQVYDVGNSQYVLMKNANGYLAPTSRTYTGLEIGRRYALNLRAIFQNGHAVTASISNATVSPFPPIVGDSNLHTYLFEFVPTATSVTLSLSESPSIEWTAITTPADPIQLANNVYESNLVNHLTLTANTAGVGWYVDRLGVVRFAESKSPITARFSDVHSTSDPLHVCYTQADLAYDTEAVINELTLSNHARKWDTSSSAYVADDVSLGPTTDLASAATWGNRAASLETSVYYGSGYEIGPGQVAARVLKGRSAPGLRISSLSFLGHDYPAIAASLDIHSRVSATRSGVTNNYRVIGINHAITTEGWTVSLELSEDY